MSIPRLIGCVWRNAFRYGSSWISPQNLLLVKRRLSWWMQAQFTTRIPMDVLLTEMNIRSYSDQAVCPEFVRKLLLAAMAASSAGDQRPWHFVVVEDRETRERMADILQPFAHMLPQAPVAILVCGDPTLQKHAGFWVQDCAAAMQNILIESRALGLGSSVAADLPDRGHLLRVGWRAPGWALGHPGNRRARTGTGRRPCQQNHPPTCITTERAPWSGSDLNH